MDMLLALFDITPDVVGLGIDPARRAYDKLINMLFGFIALILIGLAANVLGYPGMNVYLTSIFALVLAIIWWRPTQAAWVVTTSTIIEAFGNKEKKDGRVPIREQWLLENYVDIFKTILLIGTVIFFYLSFIPFSSVSVFFVIIAGTIVTYIMADKWNYGGGFAKKLLFYSACVILAFTLLFGVVPQEVWGDKQSFFGEWIASVKAKEGGIFILALFLAAIISLIDMSWDAKEKKKSTSGYTWMIFALADIMLILFTPPAFHKAWDGAVAWWNTPSSNAPQHVTPDHQEVVRSQEKSPIEVVAEPGVFTPVNIPENAYFKLKECPVDVVIVVTYDSDPQGRYYDCAEGDVHLDTSKPGLHMEVTSKTHPVALTFTTWK